MRRFNHFHTKTKYHDYFFSILDLDIPHVVALDERNYKRIFLVYMNKIAF